ncbi:metalloproteinase inhibitor 2-like [Festucalex cinctus]
MVTYSCCPQQTMMKVFIVPLVLLCLWLLQEGADACRCAPRHPQQVFCQADVVISAKVVRMVASAQSEVGLKTIKYVIKQTKMFKGPKKNFDAIYTASSSAACGVTLTTGIKYLLMAGLHSDGSLHITSCDFLKPWDDLSASQKKLLKCYEMGCNCKITRCTDPTCTMSSPTGCYWTDIQMEKLYQHYACFKKGNGSCAWYRGDASPKKHDSIKVKGH